MFVRQVESSMETEKVTLTLSESDLGCDGGEKELDWWRCHR